MTRLETIGCWFQRTQSLAKFIGLAWCYWVVTSATAQSSRPFPTSAVVAIEIIMLDRSTKTVSGCVVGDDRVLTARHNLIGASEAWVNLGAVGVFPVDAIVRDDASADLLILSAMLPEVPAVTLNDASGCAAPARVICVRRLPTGDLDERVMTVRGMNFSSPEPSVELSPGLTAGWSGSPVFDADTGALLGIALRGSEMSGRTGAAVADRSLLNVDATEHVAISAWSGGRGVSEAKHLADYLSLLATMQAKPDASQIAEALRLATAMPKLSEPVEMAYSLWLLTGRTVDVGRPLAELSDTRPDGWDYAYFAGRALFESGRAEKGVRYLRRARDLDAKPCVDYSLARAQLQMGQRAEAIATLRALSEAHPCFVGAHQLLYRLLVEMGDRNGIESVEERLVLSQPDNEELAMAILTGWKSLETDPQRLDALLVNLAAARPYIANRLRTRLLAAGQ